MASAYDETLLDVLRLQFPLTVRPFADIGQLLGAPEDEVLADSRRLLSSCETAAPLAPVFTPQAFEMTTELVAATVDEDDLWYAEKVLDTHPGVSHRAVRDHALNLWFTVAVLPTSTLGLAGTVGRLGELMGARSVRPLTIQASYGLPSYNDAGLEPPGAMPATELDRRIAERLAVGVAVDREPFTPAADALGLSPDALVTHLQQLKQRGLLRRFGASTRAERSRRTTVIGMWACDAEEADALGEALAVQPALRSVVRRRTYDDWPYPLFTSLGASTPREGRQTLARVAAAVDRPPPLVLNTLRSHRQPRLVPRLRDHVAWERMHSR